MGDSDDTLDDDGEEGLRDGDDGDLDLLDVEELEVALAAVGESLFPVVAECLARLA